MIFVKHSLYRCFFIFQGISQDAQCIFEAFFLQVIRQLYTRTGCRVKVPLNERISTAIAAILPAVIQSCLILRCRFCRIFRCNFSFRPSGISIGSRSPKIGSPWVVLPVARQTCNSRSSAKVVSPFVISFQYFFHIFYLSSFISHHFFYLRPSA